VSSINSHISHLYDNTSLTFGQIKEIFLKASNGTLKGSEKTDGIQIYLSYSVKDKKAKAVRNKINIKNGGMDAQELASKYKERGSLLTSFQNAFSTWEEAINKLNVQTQTKIFGPNTDIYYNAEIQDPDSSNVIKYDSRSLVIHQDGHCYFNKQTGDVEDIDISQNYTLLNNTIEKLQKMNHVGSFKLMNKAVITLKGFNDKTIVQSFIQRLDKIQSSLKLDDDQTIGEYVSIKLKSYIKKEFPKLTPSIIQNLINKILNISPLNINKILIKIPEEYKEKIKLLANNSSFILQEAINPIENIIHDFSVEILKGLESAFILDNRKEVLRIKQEVSQAIKTIQNSKQDEAIKILDQQLKKLKSIDNIYTATEGFVFIYDGKTYKFTGNFAPINQILGLFKYGRGNKIPPMKEIVKESDKNRIVALIPGSYKPPHGGHYEGAKYFSNIPNVNEVKIIISPKSRTNINKEMEITSDQSLKIWEIFIKNDPKINISISKKSPVQEVYDIISSLNPGDTVLLGKGDKDEENDTRFKLAQEWSDKNELGVNVKEIITPVTKKYKMGSSALRELLFNKDKENFLEYMPKHLSFKEKDDIWNILNGVEIITMKENNIKKKLIGQSCLEYKKTKQNLKEMSSVGGGSVQGFATPLSKSIKNVHKNLNKNLYINRVDLAEEIMLREKIRNIIKEISKDTLTENKYLQKMIRKYIIFEAKANVPDTQHKSTGINVLEDLLKKIIPSLEQDYKILTTSVEQRDSFKDHILNAVNKTLTSADIMQKATGKVTDDASILTKENILRQADEDIDVKVDNTKNDKFIDINKKPNDAEEEDTFSIPGKDETGRNMAQISYDKMEKQIITAYGMLSDDKDKQLFYDYLLANLKLYFNKFESEMETTVEEPKVGDDIVNNAEPPNTGNSPLPSSISDL